LILNVVIDTMSPNNGRELLLYAMNYVRTVQMSHNDMAMNAGLGLAPNGSVQSDRFGTVQFGTSHMNL